MCEKRKNGAQYVQRANERVSQEQSHSKGIKDRL